MAFSSIDDDEIGQPRHRGIVVQIFHTPDGVPKPLTTKDLAAAAAQIKPSTREWFSTARNYALYSNQGGIYDDILKFLKM